MLNVVLNISLFIFKYVGGMLSNSVSVMADAFNNLSDAFTTIITYFGVKMSSFGPGEKHPNGHGRFEWIIALVSSISIILIGWELAQKSLSSIKNPEVSVFNFFTVLVLIVSIAVKVIMYFYNTKKAKENDSESYKAIAADSISDALSTGAVLFSLILYKVVGINIDGWCGILVSIFIIYNGFKSFMESSGRIMGKAPSIEELNEMHDFILKNEDFSDVYDLQIEDFGYGRRRVSAILIGKKGVDGDKLISDVSEISAAIYERFGYDAIIHIEKLVEDKNYDYIKKSVEELIAHENTALKLSAIFLSEAGNRKKLRIEVGIPHDLYNKTEEMKKHINEGLKKISEDYIVITKFRFMQQRSKMRHHKHNVRNDDDANY